MLLAMGWRAYTANKKAIIVFAVLLLLAGLFMQFPNIYSASGTMLVGHELAAAGAPLLAVEALFVLLYLALYSSFVAITVFSARRELSRTKMHVYVTELLRRFAARIFAFYLALAVGLFAVGTVLLALGVPAIGVSAVFLVTGLFTIFVPQSIVVDEKGIGIALSKNFEFISNHPKEFAFTAVLSAVIVALIPIIEFAFDLFPGGGFFAALIIATVFAVPFTECVKTVAYMMRFDMIGVHERLLAKRKKGFLSL